MEDQWDRSLFHICHSFWLILPTPKLVKGNSQKSIPSLMDVLQPNNCICIASGMTTKKFTIISPFLVWIVISSAVNLSRRTGFSNSPKNMLQLFTVKHGRIVFVILKIYCMYTCRWFNCIKCIYVNGSKSMMSLYISACKFKTTFLHFLDTMCIATSYHLSVFYSCKCMLIKCIGWIKAINLVWSNIMRYYVILCTKYILKVEIFWNFKGCSTNMALLLLIVFNDSPILRTLSSLFL